MCEGFLELDVAQCGLGGVLVDQTIPSLFAIAFRKLSGLAILDEVEGHFTSCGLTIGGQNEILISQFVQIAKFSSFLIFVCFLFYCCCKFGLGGDF